MRAGRATCSEHVDEIIRLIVLLVRHHLLTAGLLTHPRVLLVSFVLIGTIVLSPLRTEAQELGNKLVGAIGINAGTQPEPGLYFLERLLFYSAGQIRDRNGDVIPIRDLMIDATAAVIGLSFTVKLTGAPLYTFAIGAPLANVSVNADHPNIGIDASGFGDLFVQPVKLGGRFAGFDLVGSYTIYAPTGRFEPNRVTVGRGFWTHAFSAGGAVYFDRERTQRFSALASYDINGYKRGIRIKRGNTFQIQGGAGARIYGPLDAGIAGFALWQVTDNSGLELPPIVEDARTRAFGLGPEIGATIPSIRMRFDVRAEWEFGVRSRQEGWILVTSASLLAWSPTRPAAAPVQAR
ncbi:MAG: SphA family protein [Longimicrobiales bacterium]